MRFPSLTEAVRKSSLATALTEVLAKSHLVDVGHVIIFFKRGDLPDSTAAGRGTPNTSGILVDLSGFVEICDISSNVVNLDPRKDPPELVIVERIQERTTR